MDEKMASMVSLVKDDSESIRKEDRVPTSSPAFSMIMSR
ncbi:MAG: hypothetical protein ACD_87C00040G0002 [uncultured bacterium]|nr:MAG: hypothetical protein ACD_87C00040G0002 [uncultured bacterium]